MTIPVRPTLGCVLAVAGIVIGGCVSEDEEPAAPAVEVAELSPAEHLTRVSLALRGVRPSVEELERVAAHPEELEAIVDGYLDTPEFGKVVRDLHDEALLIRVDWAYYPAGFPSVGPLAGFDPYYVNGSVEEAPLRLVEHVVMNDRPYSEIVTAGYTLANQVVAAVWGNMAYDPGGEEWQVTQWSDGRPQAGILSDPWLFTRHQSTLSNANRGRANAISKALLCYDFLSRDIEIDSNINLADPAVVANAVVDNPACASCHQGLDPLAAFFGDYFPLIVPSNLGGYPFDEYNNFDPQNPTKLPFFFPGIFELAGVEMRSPAFFGQPGQDVRDLGGFIADDPRFALCAVKRFYAYFHQVDLEDVTLEEVAELRSDFVDSGFDAKALAKAVVLDTGFRASYSDDQEVAESLVGVLKMRPEQLSQAVYDATGFRWQTMRITNETVDLPSVDLVTDSLLGFRVLAGGTDSQYVTRPAHTFNATSSLLLQTLAAEAAAHVVAQDFALGDAGQRWLLRLVAGPDAAEPEVRHQLAWLHKRLFSEMVGPDSPEVNETWELYSALLAHSGSGERAWEGTLTAMLQDVRFATY